MDKPVQPISSNDLTKQELEILARAEGRKFGHTLRYRAACEIHRRRLETFSSMVREFHKKQNLPVDVTFYEDNVDHLHVSRFLIMGEEWNETIRALLCGSKKELAHELADLMYTIVGTAITFGIEIEPVFAEVHRANMTKKIGFDKSEYISPEIKI